MMRGGAAFLRFALLMWLMALLAGCATTPRPDANPAVGARIAATAKAMVGKPYRYGASGPRAFDCSGLVYFAHRKAGLHVPRTAETQYRSATPVPLRALQAGDLVFFRIEGKLSHVGLYTGGGRFVHAPSSGRNVMISSLDNVYWRERLVGSGRLY
jgi:cell wall-associated NlpC family hydrolase